MKNSVMISLGAGVVLIMLLVWFSQPSQETPTQQQTPTTTLAARQNTALPQGAPTPRILTPTTVPDVAVSKQPTQVGLLSHFSDQERSLLIREEVDVSAIEAFDYVPEALQNQPQEEIDAYLEEMRLKLLREKLAMVMQFQDIDVQNSGIRVPEYLLDAPLYQVKAFIGRAKLSQEVLRRDVARSPQQNIELYQERRLEEKPSLYVHDIITMEQFQSETLFERKVAEEFIEDPNVLVNQRFKELQEAYGDQPDLLRQMVLEELGPDAKPERKPYRVIYNGDYGTLNEGTLQAVQECRFGNLASLLQVKEGRLYITDLNQARSYKNENQCLFRISDQDIQMKMIFVNLNIRRRVIEGLNLTDGVKLRGVGVGEVDIKLYMQDTLTKAVVVLRSNQVLPKDASVLYQYPADLQAYDFSLIYLLVISATENYYDFTKQAVGSLEGVDQSHTWELIGMEKYLEKRMDIQ